MAKKIGFMAIVLIEVGLVATVDIRVAIVTFGLLLATLRLWRVYDLNKYEYIEEEENEVTVQYFVSNKETDEQKRDRLIESLKVNG